MIVCVVGPPSAGKTTFINKYAAGFKKIISDEINKEINNWRETKRIVREKILTIPGDIIVEIEPDCISDLIDYVVEINPPPKPRRKLREEDEIYFYNYKTSNSIKNKIKLEGTNLKWEILNKRFSKNCNIPRWLIK